MNMPVNIGPIIIESTASKHAVIELEQLENKIEQIPFLPDQSFEYWSAHFAALLQCMHNHICMSYSPQTLPNYPVWSIAEVRGEFKAHFFNELERYLTNWGMQYFLVNFLNSPISANITSALWQGIMDIFNPPFRQDLIYSHFQISGKDSALMASPLLYDIKTFPDFIDLEHKYHICQNSDIAFILNNDANVITKDAVAVFGEIEGNKGILLLGDKFWRRKHLNCIFGIGVVSSKTIATQLGMTHKQYLSQYLYTPSILKCYVRTEKTGDKVVILFQQDHPIVKDFHDAMQFLRSLLQDGKSTHIYEQFSEPFRQAAFILRTGLRTPVLQLLDQFALCSGQQLIGAGPNCQLNQIVQMHR